MCRRPLWPVPLVATVDSEGPWTRGRGTCACDVLRAAGVFGPCSQGPVSGTVGEVKFGAGRDATWLTAYDVDAVHITEWIWN